MLFSRKPLARDLRPRRRRPGREAFAARRDQHYTELLQGEPEAWAGQEESPYEQQPLGIKYPYFAPQTLWSAPKKPLASGAK